MRSPVAAVLDHPSIDPETAREFLIDCGLTPDEILTLSQFDDLFASKTDLLVKKRVPFETIHALAVAAPAVRSDVLRDIEKDAAFSASDVRGLDRDRANKLMTDDARVLSVRNACIEREAARIAKEEIENFVALAQQLYDAYPSYDKDNPYPQSDEITYPEWRKRLASLGTDLLRKFDRLFPDAEVPKAMWGDAKNHSLEKELLAQARYTLDQIARGWLPPRIDSDLFFGFSRYSAAGSLRFLTGFTIDTPQRPKIGKPVRSIQAKAFGTLRATFPAFATKLRERSVMTVQNSIRHSDLTAPRPLRALRGVEIAPSTGGMALGMEHANFRKITLCIEQGHQADDQTETETEAEGGERVNDKSIVGLNTKPWSTLLTKVHKYGEQPNFRVEWVTEATSLLPEVDPIDLVAGTLSLDGSTRHSNARQDQRDAFFCSIAFIERLLPKSFFFECAASFPEPRYTGMRYDIRSRYHKLGYTTRLIPVVDARMFGLPQARVRSILIGIRRDLGVSIDSPSLMTPVSRRIGDAIFEVGFPHYSRLRDKRLQSEFDEKAQEAYDRWTTGWMKDHGHKVVPDTLTLDPARRGSNPWRAAGFTPGSDEIFKPVAGAKRTNLPLSIPILKRIQGLPLDWQVSGDYETQVEKISRTTPPVIARAVAHTIYAGLTGQVVDLDRAARQEITTGSRPRTLLRPIAEMDDPERFMARQYEAYIRHEEETLQLLPCDDDD
ncbi:DNA cytosine methyltransferase [Rhizobium sp.]|uniref:DNA cytosine methyltransferase n=1 Tax=Rhizobium sp. TaxID=391 RepID=UPI0028A78294